MSTDDNKIEKILSHNYNLDDILKINKIKFLGNNSKNFLIYTKNGKFVYHKLENIDKLSNLEKILHIQNKLSEKIKIVSKPIKNNNNLFVLKNYNIMITKFYEGDFFNGSEKEIISFSKTLGILHNELRKINTNYNFVPYKKYFKKIQVNELEQIYQSILKKNKIDKFDEILIKNFEFILQIILEQKKDIKKNKNQIQLIHGDLHQKNIIFLNNNVNAILDFHTMRKGLPIEDVVFAAFRFSIFNQKFYKKNFNTFIENYKKTNNNKKFNLKNAKYYLTEIILSRISFLLRKRYFENNKIWEKELKKQIIFLKKVKELQIFDNL